MKVFGDTVHFIALLSTTDRWHARAIAINRQSPGALVTTEWVLTEVGDAFSHPTARQKFIRLLQLLKLKGNKRMWRSFHLQVICSAAVRTFIPRDYKEARNSASQVMSLVKPRNAKGRVILARGPNPGSWKSEDVRLT